MTTGILKIRSENPEHIDIARAHKLWDTYGKGADIQRGDEILFWQAGQGRFVGRGVATTAARPKTPKDTHPWNDKVGYQHRFDINFSSDPITFTGGWHDLQARSGFSAGDQQAVVELDDAAAQRVNNIY